MNPEFIDRMGWEMAEVYGAITDQILVNLAKYFPYYQPGASVPKSAFTYQAAMLAQVGQVNMETLDIIRKGLKSADSALYGALEQAIIDSVSKAEKPLLQAVKQGIFAPPGTITVSPNQYKAFDLYYKQASSRLNLVNTVMLESTESAYVQTVNDVAAQVQYAERIAATQTALDIGAGEAITGVSSWNEAVRHSINRMKEKGITGFVDHAGHQWSAEAYTAMDIRTTMMNTGRAAVWETNQQFGNDLYLVSYHNGARPLCYDWQNKVISSTNNARDTYDLDGNVIHVYAQSETTYGEAAGLFGVNCKHYPSPFIPGVSIIRGEPQSEEANKKAYAESQQQRGLERKLREEKRDLMMAKAQGAPPEEITRLRDKCRQTSADIDQFCEDTGRARHRDREGVYTERSFPDKDKYDVAAFERGQKEYMEQYFKGHDMQQQYKAGVMQPKAPIVPPATPAQPKTAQQANAPKGKSTLVKETLPKTGIEKVNFTKWEHTPTAREIIDAIGGADKTSGSCASVGLAYAGNKAGYKVHDFRGGKSLDWFSTKTNTEKIARLKGVDGVVIKAKNEVQVGKKLLAMMEPGKEYWLGIGRHASIVRALEDGTYQYLELQAQTQYCGWKRLYGEDTLMSRFGCVRRRSQALPARLIDIEKLGNHPDFPEILKYINTAVDAQKKGIGGGIK